MHTDCGFLPHFINASVLQTHFINLTTFPAKPHSNKNLSVYSIIYQAHAVYPIITLITMTENRGQKQCSLTTGRHCDFTQVMSVKRKIEGQINSL